MKVTSNRELTEYCIYLSHDEAVDLNDFLGKYCRSAIDGIPRLETQICNGLFEEGLSKHYHEKWKREYE